MSGDRKDKAEAGKPQLNVPVDKLNWADSVNDTKTEVTSIPKQGNFTMDTGNDGLGSAPQPVEDHARTRTMIQSLMNTHGVPSRVPPSRHTALLASIYSLFGAKSKEQKEAVIDTMVYLCIVHGCGPNVEWSEIDIQPAGCTPKKMSEVVDGIITRKYHRRFMTTYGNRAAKMYEASPELQAQLVERAVRNGLAVTDAMNVIDFLDSSAGVSTGALALRMASKYSAVQRANRAKSTGMAERAGEAASAMHGYADADGDSLGGV